MTPFHFACVRGNLELCELFMEYKADIKARTVEEKTPLHLAALRGNEAVVELLIKKGWFCRLVVQRNVYCTVLGLFSFLISVNGAHATRTKVEWLTSAVILRLSERAK